MRYYSATIRNELPSLKKIWMNLKCILLNERNQFEKATYCMIPIIGHSGKDKTIDTVKDQWLPRGQGRVRETDDTQEIFRMVKLFCTIL